MLEVRISGKMYQADLDVKGNLVKHPAIRFSCYRCKKERTFFGMQATFYCPTCHFELPDVYAMLNTLGHKVYWHRDLEVP